MDPAVDEPERTAMLAVVVGPDGHRDDGRGKDDGSQTCTV
jgi:hypothetical protein